MAERSYSDTDFAWPEAVCDVIMKGGITSGVVYPLVITELAKHYRFAHIGGTSAGAIAAAAAAAAEYGRHASGKGFIRLAKVPDEVGGNLFSLFQPTPKLRPLFRIFVAALQAKTNAEKVRGAIAGAIFGCWWFATLGALPGVAIALLAFWLGALGFFLFGLLLGAVGLVGGVLYALHRSLMKHLPANNFGLCPGIRQRGHKGPGFTDWLADLIDDAEGRDPRKDPPLTFGDLEAPPGPSGAPDPSRKIELSMMTTNLMLRRPFTLPFRNKAFKFKRQDFEQIFPRRIVEHLVTHSEKDTGPSGNGDFYTMPAAALPIVVAARLSLSFPGLISAVPLYARDFTLNKEEERQKLRLCLFSDGGLSSNFPIQFFDNVLPTAPTFGISLDVYDPRRDPSAVDTSVGKPDDGADDQMRIRSGHESRVWLPNPENSRSGQLTPFVPFDGLFGFIIRLVEAAKDWQDNLQSTLAGYRDRIVHIYLKPEEGGLNITMPPALVKSLSEYGAEAGALLRDKFNLDEHRWRRFLVAMDRINEVVGNFEVAFNAPPGGAEPFAKFLTRYDGHQLSYRLEKIDFDILRAQADGLAGLAATWQAGARVADDKFPHPQTTFRITPKP